MTSILNKLVKKNIVSVTPSFVAESIQYEVIMGSVAYGVSNDSSDTDVFGFCIPPKDYVFPHLRGEVAGFTPPGPRFDQYQQHHIKDVSAAGGKGKEYDFSIYSIVKYFRLCAENNPNIIDSLFVPRRCILHSTRIGDLLRDNRHIFLHKGAWPKFKGYAYGQMRKMHTKEAHGKRKQSVEAYGYDVKFAYHIVRLLNEVEQILVEGDLDLERNREQLKSIRSGRWTLQQIEDYFEQKENELEQYYLKSDLPHKPDMQKLQALLLECLETYYGSLGRAIVQADELSNALRNIDEIVNKVRGKL